MPETETDTYSEAAQDGCYGANKSQDSSPALQILIVGCGIGGLVAAIACRRGGHEVTILEQALELQEVGLAFSKAYLIDRRSLIEVQQMGAGIQLPPNATRALRSLGLLSDIEAVSSEPRHIALRSYGDSTILSMQNLVPLARDHYNAPYLVVHRADLIRVLVQEAVSLGIIMKLSSTVTKYNFVEPSLSTSDGETYAANVIIGCDGERSSGREALMGFADSPISSGDTVFRLTVDYSKLRQDADLKYLIESPHVNAWLGPRAHAVSYPLEKQKLLNVALTQHHSGAGLVSPQSATADELSNILNEWDPTVVKLLNLAQTLTKWKLLQPCEVHKWTHPLGTFTLLGDSAHPALPFL